MRAVQRRPIRRPPLREGKLVRGAVGVLAIISCLAAAGTACAEDQRASAPEARAAAAQVRPPTAGWEDVTREFTGEEFLAWPNGKVDGRDVRVSPTLSFASGFEINHHRVKVEFAGDGSVELSVAHHQDDKLDEAVAKSRLHSGFKRVKSGQEILVSSPQKANRCAWLIVQTKGDARVTKITYTCWRGRGTVFGHSPGVFQFAGAKLPYRLMYPRTYDPAKSYPLVISVHGSGGVGTDNYRSMENVILAKFLFTTYYFDKDLECFSLVTQILPNPAIPKPYWPAGEKGAPDSFYHPDWPAVNENGYYVQATLALIRALIDGGRINIDPDRVYYTGFSYGGKACWEFLRAGRETFAAAMSGGGWPIGRAFSDPTHLQRKRLEQEVQRHKHIPVFIFAGENDLMRRGSRAVHEVILAQSGKGKYVEIPRAGHIDSAARGWLDRENILWLFRQSRKDNPAPGDDPFPGGVYPQPRAD